MCMACEQEFMYQAYLAYLARKAAEGGEAITAEEKAFLEASGFACDPVPQPDATAPKVSGFTCDPVSDAAAPVSPFSRMGPKAT